MIEEARNAVEALLAERAEDAGSGETFTFESSAEEGAVIVLKYRARHPEWLIRTHSIVTVAYDPNGKTARIVGR